MFGLGNLNGEKKETHGFSSSGILGMNILAGSQVGPSRPLKPCNLVAGADTLERTHGQMQWLAMALDP